MSDTLGAIYSVWQNDNSVVHLDPECAPVVDRAVKLWAERRMDTWLSVQGAAGNDYSLLASTITSAMLSTADQRADATMRDKAIEDERAEHRRLAGFIESE